MERVVDEVDFVATPDYYMDWIEGGSLVANPPWDDDTKTGAYGAGSHGTAEKGRLWLEAAIEEKADHVEQIHEQHERREEEKERGLWILGKKLTANQLRRILNAISDVKSGKGMMQASPSAHSTSKGSK